MSTGTNGQARKAGQKQYLRDAEHLDFLSAQIDRLAEFIKTGVKNGELDDETEKRNVRRLRLLQRNVNYNATEIRRRGDEFVEDEW